jgi:hypothetical protein
LRKDELLIVAPLFSAGKWCCCGEGGGEIAEHVDQQISVHD